MDTSAEFLALIKSMGNRPAEGTDRAPAKGTSEDTARQLHKLTRSAWHPVAGRGAEESDWRGREARHPAHRMALHVHRMAWRTNRASHGAPHGASQDAEQEAMLEAAMRNSAGGDWAAPSVPRQLSMPELLLQDGVATNEANEAADAGWATWGLHKHACLVCGASLPEVRTMRCAGSGCVSCPARYCSAEHQRKAWKLLGHNSSCGQPLPSPDSIRTALPTALVSTLKEFGGLDVPLVAACLARCSQLFDGGVLAPGLG